MSSKNNSVVAISCSEKTQQQILKYFRTSDVATKLADVGFYPSNSEFLKLGVLGLHRLDLKFIKENVDVLKKDDRFREALLEIQGAKK